MRTTEKQLNELVKDICKLTGLADSKEQAKLNGEKSFLALENAACYGGWRLINISVEHGGHFGAFGGSASEARIKGAAMYEKLRGIINGLEFKNK